jgi:hypothetical protein
MHGFAALQIAEHFRDDAFLRPGQLEAKPRTKRRKLLRVRA